MSKKSKGINAERELLHLFWGADFVALRAPASGSIRYPCPDLLAGTLTRKLAIECKATRAQRVYIGAEQVKNLKRFGAIFGAECWIGVRFDKLEWHFIALDDLAMTEGGNHVVSQKHAKRRGLLFEELIATSPLSRDITSIDIQNFAQGDAKNEGEDDVHAKPAELPAK